MANHTIYLRTLKKAEHTVFGVQDGQKKYYDPQFGKYIPYSSGQQVKHSILNKLTSIINKIPSPTTFVFGVSKNDELGEGEVFASCDPSFPDQLFGGWMKASQGGKERTLKRRSPLSISAMRGLHPLLCGINKENLTFDRSDRSNNKVIVRDADGNELSTEEIKTFLEGKDRSISRKWIPNKDRATGLFVQDIAIDLRRLFSVNLNPYEPEINEETEKKLIENGWIESENIFGKCLVVPKKIRDQLAPALAEALIHWAITSNQSRTFSLMETLSLAISENANKIAGSIRAKLHDEDERRAKPIIEEDMEGVEAFVTLTAGGYVLTKSESANALEEAEKYLIEKINEFDFESQL